MLLLTYLLTYCHHDRVAARVHQFCLMNVEQRQSNLVHEFAYGQWRRKRYGR